ncbi:MAG: citrate (Si)-synthase [Myxococcales bacterium]|nr:citrate (Si)-synthase [Myxococcales bacterium]
MILHRNESTVTPQPISAAAGVPSAEVKNIGLRGVTIADSAICKVDGANGILLYRGFDIKTLAQNATFEEVAHLLLRGKLPNPKELATFKKKLAEYRQLPAGIIAALQTIPAKAAPMDVLQALNSLLAAYDPDLTDESKEANYRKGARLIARFPLVVAAWHRIRQGLPVAEPDPSLSHAAAFLFALLGKEATAEQVRNMDVALTLHAEHSFNASTFTCRQIASTRAHLYASIGGAIGSLSGELHGGANAQVYQMLKEVGHKDKVRDYVVRTLDEGGRIMGMGHAIYKVLDPRAQILGPMSKALGEKSGDPIWYELSEEIQRVTKEEFKRRKGADINANVDFFSASVYHYMGIPVDLFTPIFAVSRVAGWAAHYIEEKFAEAAPKPALYRPKAEYIGRYCGPEGCQWEDLDHRA